MALVWNPYSLLGILPLLAGWGMAVIVFRAAPGRLQNRRLALLLAVEGSWLFAEFGVLFLADDPGTAYAATGLWGALLVTVPWVYLSFLGTLDTPFATPLRGRVAAALLGAGAITSASLVILTPEQFATYGPTWFARFSPVPGPWIGIFNTGVSVVVLYALVVVFTAWRRLPRDSPRKPGAGAYLIAVGFRDAFLAVVSVHLALTIFGVGSAATDSWLFNLEVLSIPVVYLASAVLLAYGILRTQLFDIDLKIKWTVSRGTVAAVFVGVFFVVSELAATFLSDLVGRVLGIVAAGLLVVFLAPLQRFADRLTDRAMPAVRDSDEYRTVRKREVYRAAVESAMQDGRITDRERDVLATLQEQLGIAATDAVMIERELAQPSDGGLA